MRRRATPERIVEQDGRVHTGWFDHPFADANLPDAPVRHLLSRLRGGPLGAIERGYRRLRLKRWHYTSVVTEHVFFGCAVVDAGYVGTAFAYLVDRRSGAMHEWTTMAPLARGIEIAPGSVDGTTSIDAPGWGRITLDNDAARATRRVEVDLEGVLGPRSKPPLHVRYTIEDDGVRLEPVIVVEDCGGGRWLYTHKAYGLAAGGRVECGALHDDAPAGTALAGLDYNCGYRPNETYWNWAAAAGRAKSGKVIGFNLTAHRRPGEPPGASHDATDCALWLDRACVKIPSVQFDYDTTDLGAPWDIRDGEGLVDLRFHPAGERSEDTNFGLVVSRFHQPYGTFVGTLRDRAGAVHEIDGVYGVTEQHFARW